ncbi:30S ribosomal protein S10 [Candidatus Pinguicoccus supinus]|uniref:Small ribosomal subunit protein uS10 n=1 Tax=Candidatus Pinguicoccus supinus TaxID=2529394 RepID=A0A7T0FXX4_9BACT|nr:30S ribosomal protein S10 [Candidatus Pinguicoccus supinus]
MENSNLSKLKNKIRIILRSYHYKNIIEAVNNIMSIAFKTGSVFKGPVPLPVIKKKFAVNRSPHSDKESMDIFEIRIYKRLLDIIQPSPSTVDELKKLNLSSGVDINIII